jgi:hypothetical protein
MKSGSWPISIEIADRAHFAHADVCRRSEVSGVRIDHDAFRRQGGDADAPALLRPADLEIDADPRTERHDGHNGFGRLALGIRRGLCDLAGLRHLLIRRAGTPRDQGRFARKHRGTGRRQRVVGLREHVEVVRGLASAAHDPHRRTRRGSLP